MSDWLVCDEGLALRSCGRTAHSEASLSLDRLKGPAFCNDRLWPTTRDHWTGCFAERVSRREIESGCIHAGEGRVDVDPEWRSKGRMA